MPNNLKNKEDLYYLAYHDSLTGLTNEKYFKKELKKKIENNNKKNKLAVLYVKISNLSKVNNFIGYQESNNLIINIVEILQSLKSKLDFELISIYKKEEFLIILNYNKNMKLVEQKINILENKIMDFFKDKSLNHLLKANIGISIYPDHAQDADSLLSRVHNALYIAEETGKNCIFYNQKIFEEYLEKENLQQNLKNAIQKKELFLEYQPIINFKNNNKIKFLEALIRWKHPEKGFISPVDFIPQAEKTGLIKMIGIFVLEEVFKQLQSCQNKKIKNSKFVLIFP